MDVTDSKSEHATSLFNKYSIEQFQKLFSSAQYAKLTNSRELDHLIQPFKLSRDEKKLKTELYRIAIGPTADIPKGVPDHLIKFLIFHPPKPMEHISATALSAKYDEIPKRPAGGGGAKRRGGSMAADAQPTKRQRQDSKLKNAEPMSSSMFVEEIEYKAPENLQSILSDVFTKFWELDIDPIVSTPFFALITPYNCGPVFGMPDYFDKVTDACTLANIKEKMDAKKYSTASAFEYDFDIMLNNVFLYYPKDSVQYAKAVELKQMFADLWAGSRSKLR